MDAIIGGLILWLLLSGAVAVYADNRGRSGGLYFVISLLLSPVLGFVIAAIASSEKPTPVLADVARSEMKKCPDCAEMIQGEARKCRFCGALFEVISVASQIAPAAESFVAPAAPLPDESRTTPTPVTNVGSGPLIATGIGVAIFSIVIVGIFALTTPSVHDTEGHTLSALRHAYFALNFDHKLDAPPTSDGYAFRVTPAENGQFSITASPIKKFGLRFFFVDQTGIIRESLTDEASELSLPLSTPEPGDKNWKWDAFGQN